jgi:transcriptional regulator with XRE-family HTH domain
MVVRAGMRDEVKSACGTYRQIADAFGITVSQVNNLRNRAPRKCNWTGGESHGNHKLTMVQVDLIVSELAKGVKGVELARRFGVTPQTISRINKKKCWLEVTDPWNIITRMGKKY